MNEPEELPLSDLLDDEFEGATRVLPKTAMNSYPPVAMPASVPPKKSDAPIWAAVFGATFMFAIAAVGAAIFLFVQHRHAGESEDTTTAALAPTATETATPTATATATATETTAQNLEPLALTSPSATPHVAYVPHGSGVLQTFAVGRGKTVYVDGRSVGVGGSHIKTACGKHSIAVGSSKAHTYEVPCNGGTITVGTPDGS